jgi:translation initiation factor IF-3
LEDLFLQVITRALARNFNKLRLVSDAGNEIVSVMDALARADEAGLDLCLISDKGDVPVAKIQDFKKIQYELKKSKKKQVVQDLKEIQLKLNIADHDFQTKVSAVDKFLARGDKVKIVVRLKGRERENPERGRALLDRMIAAVKCKASHVPGPITMAVLEPIGQPKA